MKGAIDSVQVSLDQKLACLPLRALDLRNGLSKGLLNLGHKVLVVLTGSVVVVMHADPRNCKVERRFAALSQTMEQSLQMLTPHYAQGMLKVAYDTGAAMV